MHRFLMSSVLAALAASPLSANDGWLTNMDEAMAQAAREGKHILMDFTGSDWCGWCIKLRDEVFSQDVFIKDAPTSFVLVELDFPAQKELSEEQKAHNQQWAEKFDIQGYPTIVLTDAGGNLFARTGYREGGPDAYLEHLSALRQGKVALDGLLAKAGEATGIARAKLLDEALQLKDVQVADRGALMDEIVALDADNGAGLKARYEQVRLEMAMDEELTAIESELYESGPEAAMEKLKAFEQRFPNPGTRRIGVLRSKAIALHMSGEAEQSIALLETSLKDETLAKDSRQELAMVLFQVQMQEGNADKATAAINTAIALDPDSDLGQNLTKQKDQIFEMIRQQTAGGDHDDHDGHDHDDHDHDDDGSDG